MAGDSEFGQCSFCKEQKPITRKYLYPTNYVRPEDIAERCKLYNEGSYFIIVYYCADCGEPKT